MTSHKPDERNPLSLASPNLGLLFLEFLHFYHSFDQSAMEVAPLPPNVKIDRNPFGKRSPIMFGGNRQQGQAEFFQMLSTIAVKDPLNPANNVTRNARKYILLRVFSK